MELPKESTDWIYNEVKKRKATENCKDFQTPLKNKEAVQIIKNSHEHKTQLNNSFDTKIEKNPFLRLSSKELKAGGMEGNKDLIYMDEIRRISVAGHNQRKLLFSKLFINFIK